jgi:hypothetical protein
MIVGLALKVSIMFTLLGFGLHATYEDVLYLLRRPLAYASVVAMPGRLGNGTMVAFIAFVIVGLHLAIFSLDHDHKNGLRLPSQPRLAILHSRLQLHV